MDSIGRYQLVEKLGQGGMGIVYRAFDTLLQRVVAVKVILGTIESGGEQRERFFREARAAGQLSHRNIITIHDLGEHEGQPYLAMEFLEGEDLQRRMTRPDRMSLGRKIDLAIDICEGLEYAHVRGIVHRDIKPANIFITDNGTTKILDFGLARLVTSELTNSNMMMGTANYMAPEQVRGERADHRSDIFAVGVVLYELLGGRKAFEGESFATTLYNILQREPESLRSIDPSLPPELVAIVERALAKPRDERYQQISEMLRDLAVVRQQLGYETPAGGRPASRPGYDASTITLGTTPLPGLPSGTPGAAPAPRTPAPQTAAPSTPAGTASPSGSGQAVVVPQRAIWIGGAVAALALVAFVTWMVTRPTEPAAPQSAAASTEGAAGQAAITTAFREATEALESGDFAAAQKHADAVLALAPDHADARRVRDRASETLARVTQGLGDARAHFAAGRFDEASRAAGDVLTLVPGHAEARTLMQDAAERSRGTGAAAARTRMIQAKNAARAAGAASLAAAPYKAALGTEREAQRLYDAKQLAEATAKFYEASGLFQSAELSAQSEAAARAERAALARAEKPRPEKPASTPRQEPERAASPAQPPPSPAPAAQPPPKAPEPEPLSVTPPGASRGLDPTLPGAGTSLPAPSPPKPAAPPEPSAESLIGDLLGRYESALEARNLAALRQIWPGLGGNESAIRDEFEHARRISVEIISPRIDVSGNAATAIFTRAYELVTTDGQRVESRSVVTMRCRRAGGGWVIEQARYELIR